MEMIYERMEPVMELWMYTTFSGIHLYPLVIPVHTTTQWCYNEVAAVVIGPIREVATYYLIMYGNTRYK